MQFSANTPYTIYARVCTKTVDSLVPGFSIDTTGGTTPGLSKKDSGLFPQSVLCGCNDGSKSAPNG